MIPSIACTSAHGARFQRPRRSVLLATVALALSALPALAHPHIWVTTRTAVLYENGSIVGLRHSWTFDPSYTEMATEGLDKNNDGDYSREELAELAKVNVDALKEFSYFTFPKLAGAALEVAPPKDYYLEHKLEKPSPGTAPAVPTQPSGADKVAEAAGKPVPVLTLHFTLPLAKPVLAEAPNFTFSLGDPSFFIAFEPAADEPVKLGEGAPRGCTVERDEEKPQAAAPPANPSKPGDVMAGEAGDVSVNIVSAPVWKVFCKARGSSG